MAGRLATSTCCAGGGPFALVAFEGGEGTADMVERAELARSR